MTGEVRYRAPAPGQLPATPGVILGGARLPRGRLVSPDPSFTGRKDAQPVLWITDKLVPKVGAIWKKVAAGFSSHGLWPLVLQSAGGDDERPWLAGDLDPSLSTSPGAHDAGQALAARWRDAGGAGTGEDDGRDEHQAQLLEALAPFGRGFPGLAPACGAPGDPDAPAGVAAGASGRLGLVAVTRPADTLAALGWTGPANHFSDMGVLGAVLRSWEERFGAWLVAVGFDTLLLGVERPPCDPAAALAVAAEHFAVCPDIVFQGAGTLRAYAAMLPGEPAWALWWEA